MTDGDEKRVNKLLFNLIAEIQSLAVAFKRIGERMVASNSSREKTALILLSFFQEQQVAMTTYQTYLDAVRELETSGKLTVKQIKYIDSLCAKKLLKKYGITF